jgi:hypothetical protein
LRFEYGFGVAAWREEGAAIQLAAVPVVYQKNLRVNAMLKQEL